MSGLWGWFGGGSAAQKRKDTPKNVILDLRAQLEMLQKREVHLTRQIEEQEQVARKNVNTNKTAAKAALRRKKIHEHNLEQTLNHIGTIEQQVNAIESANINQETFVAMQRAGDAMKSIHGKLTPTKVDETMDKLQEYNRLNEEIADAMGSISVGPQLDDTELEDELEELQQQQIEDKMLETGPVPVDRLPAVANGEIKGKAPAVAEDDEEAELKRLQAEMAM
ncbi:Snf7-domain-containing protein [Chaetomium sp. MPI-SDFR-AT-0129]|uniref:Vacuolar-sorting protein SNF7 n=1 Tax=Dichotomopilus funicola TaxID=1934379 RepID=A0AAN6ZJN5_9PEZI|nr:Snf7-domain-containing protein [Chaetomium sp. MPI-SDFR-AT-0129]KAK4139866.1 Snf7-domain-containing protein [Dichotomopilus funicola]